MTLANRKFTVDLGWRAVLDTLGMPVDDLLRHAGLPRDLFARTKPELSTDEYFRLWASLETLLGDAALPLKLGQAVSAESFSPPLFAAFCSPDLETALRRLAQYKPLIGPLTLDLSGGPDDALVARYGAVDGKALPAIVAATELVFLVNLARRATRTHIVPTRIGFAELPPEPRLYADFFGAPVEAGPENRLEFSQEDAARPFLSVNEAMFSIFEPVLGARLEELHSEPGFRERVRASLMEALPSGRCSMADIAGRLAVSSRTLQRRLAEEGTTFLDELNGLRSELARHYLTRSDYSSAEISFLLGYNDPNSFYRAVHAWTGRTPQAIRTGAGPQ